MELLNYKNITYTKIYLLLFTLVKSRLNTFNCIYLYRQGYSVSKVALWLIVVYAGYIIFH